VKQLVLNFQLAPGYAEADFCAAPSNALARQWLAQPAGWSNGRLVLWGAEGCGKTHLLHIWAAARNALILDVARIGQTRPHLAQPLAIDDVDIIADAPALLHLLNDAAAAGQPVLMTARQPPARQNFDLADLGSRLRASLAVEIRAPEDELLDMLLARLTAERQLALPEGVRRFMLTRLPRTAAALREAVARLDRAAMQAGGKINRGLAEAVLAELLDEREVEADTAG